ncbi:MAG: prepilin-type N-terminal cleavage/methylation domain-containing protein [Deltaproteobacteria bacterium]|nr:prepilin-type N-terminal cleavage/methylation domain-containing protein [Deltaproteobacteria bacterium]
MKTKAQKSDGFTLVELLIALALSLVVLTSVSSAFISQ